MEKTIRLTDGLFCIKSMLQFDVFLLIHVNIRKKKTIAHSIVGFVVVLQPESDNGCHVTIDFHNIIRSQFLHVDERKGGEADKDKGYVNQND